MKIGENFTDHIKRREKEWGINVYVHVWCYFIYTSRGLARYPAKFKEMIF